MFAADDTIEASRRISSIGKPVANGSRTLHYCRNLNSVRDIVEGAIQNPLKVLSVYHGDTVRST